MNNRPASSSVNSPVNIMWRDGTSRLMNLVIALTQSKQARPFTWIQQHVAGYGSPADAQSAKRQFDRDRMALKEFAGIELKEQTVDSGFGSAKETIKGWSLDAEAIFMPHVEFSAQEKEVLATASQWAHGHDQQAVARTAFRKLASTGIAAQQSQSVVSNVPDHTDLDEDSLQALFRALDGGVVIEFDHYPAPLTAPTRRQLEPWAYATIGGRMYVTGFDPDKNAQRTFRLARMGGVMALSRFITHHAPQGVSGHELVRNGLSRAGELIDAKVEFRGPGAWELRAAAENSGPEAGPLTAGTSANTTDTTSTATIRGVPKPWLVRTAAAYATDAIITSPADVAAEVREILECAAREDEVASVESDNMVPETGTATVSESAEPRFYGEQFVRCVDLLAWFNNHPRGSFMAAARDLNTSVPQVKHELKQLEFCGLPGYFPGSLIEFDFHKTGATVVFSAGIDSPLRLMPSEAAAIRISLDAIRDVMAPEFLPIIDTLAKTIAGLALGASSLSDAHTHAEAAVPQAPEVTGEGEQRGVELKKEKETEGGPHPQLSLQLAAAIRQRQTVEVDYTSVSSDSRTRRALLPDHLGVVDGETYLWAREADETKPGQRKYALSRMVLHQVGAPNSAGPRVPANIDTANPFGWDEDATWVTVAVAESARWMLEYQQMWVIDDDMDAHGGDIIVTMPDTGDWIERFIIAYTPSVRCVQPLELTARVRNRARRGLTNYSG